MAGRDTGVADRAARVLGDALEPERQAIVPYRYFVAILELEFSIELRPTLRDLR